MDGVYQKREGTQRGGSHLNSEELGNYWFSRFLEEEHVAAVPGTAFGESGEGFVRISYAYSLGQLKAAMEKLAHFITKLRNEKQGQ